VTVHRADIVPAMEAEPYESASEQDWRLEAELDVAEPGGALRSLLGRVRGPDVVKELEDVVPREVVITHDGTRLFAYAADEASLAAARRGVEEVLARDGITARVRVSHWDDEHESWRQTDPPASAEERQARALAERDGETIATRTLVVSSGRLIREEVEQTMRDWAEKLGLECKTVEHPHLLTSQVAFTVTGPKRKIDEFARALRAEALTSIRTETEVILSQV
jgi:hypothetical protein